MKLDDLDRKIIGKLMEREGYATTCDLAKDIYEPKDKYDLQKLSNRIAYRLKKFAEYGLVEISNHKEKKEYRINPDNVYLDECWLKIGDEKEAYLGLCIVLEFRDSFFIFAML